MGKSLLSACFDPYFLFSLLESMGEKPMIYNRFGLSEPSGQPDEQSLSPLLSLYRCGYTKVKDITVFFFYFIRGVQTVQSILMNYALPVMSSITYL